jgi:hypothetical protein
MTNWMEMVLRSAFFLLRSLLADMVDSLSAEDVERAKEQIKAAIQRQHRLPGILRRWLCSDVDRLNAATVGEFKELLAGEFGRIG